MELTTSNRRDTAIVAATPSDKRCIALRERYGDDAAMMAAWAPARATQIAMAAGRSAGAPSLVLMMRTYGTDTMRVLLRAHITAAVAAAGLSDRFAADDYERLAEMMLASERLRTLNMAYIVRFFTRFAAGELEMYGYTPHAVMRCVNVYAKAAHEEQRRVVDAERKRAEDEAWRQHQREAMSWREYARLNGLNENDNPLG